MKSLLASLVVAGACLAGSTASAAVYVDAGPARVTVCRPAVRVCPVYRTIAVRPVAVRPVVRTPVVVTPVHYHWYHRYAWHWHHW
jgi:hypothetical protein